MSIKEKLLEAGRYSAILNILEKIIKDDQSSYPTDAYRDYSLKETKWRVDGEDVRKQAAILYAKISFEVDETLKEEDYFYLRQYISSETCMMLHNYAVSISHRNDNPKEDMEVIRTWEILENLLFNLDDVSSWTIPNGWEADEVVSNRNKGIVEEQFKAMGLEIEENDEVHVLEWFVSTNGNIIRLLVEDNMYKVYCSDQLIATTRFTEDGYMQALEVFKVLQQDKECVWEFSELSPTVTVAGTECGHNHVNFKSDMKRCPYCYGIITNK